MVARALIIAGSDSGGGAGIQGDIKTVTCLGGYAATAITALTAQNTTGVYGIHPVPPEFVAQQIRVVLSDIGADSIKTGMLCNAGIIEAVADALLLPSLAGGEDTVPLIIDPVMVAKGGAVLLQPEAVEALKTRLFPLATLITPNIPEAELLAGMKITTLQHMEKAAAKIMAYGAQGVLIKGGHLEGGEAIMNVLLHEGGFQVFETTRINTKHTHGTGCTMASAIATFLAQKKSLSESVNAAQAYVSAAIKNAPQLGQGQGPLGHFLP